VSASNPSRLISVKLTPVGRPHTFVSPERAGDRQPHTGDQVVVQDENGTAVGTVVRSVPQLVERRLPSGEAPPRIIRVATREDIVTRLKQEHREKEAFRIASLKIRERGLGMKLARVEMQFDGSRMIFYFTAEGRDEAKMIGGYGTCGRPLCCTTFLTSFEPVSIKMAKQQELSLNPSKLSGLCGRLKCCLRYELPNAKGVAHGGCGSEGACDNPTGCGTGSCGHGCSCRT